MASAPPPQRADNTALLYPNFGFTVSFEAASTEFKLGAGELFGGFAEVSGLEAMMEHKAIKVGGRNYGTAMRAGPVTFGTVVLKRGVMRPNALWGWWAMFAGADQSADARPLPANRCNVVIGLTSAVPPTESATPPPSGGLPVHLGWRLRNAMPVKFRVGDLNARGSDVAVEEIHLVHEGLEMKGVGA